jgi:hypothetical protein
MNVNLQSRPLVVAVWSFAALPWLVLLLALVILYGCVGPQAKAPQGIPEQIEAANLFAEKLSDTLAAVTCTQFKAGACIEPGKPLMPKDAIKMHDQLETAHQGLAAASSMGAGGIADCMGTQRTQTQCVTAVSGLLTQIDAYLIAKKGGK